MSRDKDQVIINQNVPAEINPKQKSKCLQTARSKEKLQTSQVKSKMYLEMGNRANRQIRCLEQDVGMRCPTELSGI